MAPMCMPNAVFPIVTLPFDTESGLGFCLRASVENGTNIHGLRRLAKMRDGQQINKSDIPSLGSVLGGHEGWLSLRLRDDPRIARNPVSFLAEPAFTPTLFRWIRPQVCPQCIHLYEFCKLEWDIGMSTVCLEHQTDLSDICNVCGQGLRWDRISMYVGHCGHVIQSQKSKNQKVDEDRMAIQALITAKVKQLIGMPSQSLESIEVPRVLRQATLAGVLVLLSSFGCSDDLGRNKVNVSNSYQRTHVWASIGLSGLNRLRLIERGELRLPKVDSYVLWPLLERLLSSNASANDAALCLDLLSTLGLPSQKLEAIRQRSGYGQYKLFD